jgi:hypothetical protein
MILNKEFCASKIALIIYEELMKKPLVDHLPSYQKLLEIIELVSDNDAKTFLYPYTIPFVTGLWHEYIQYDVQDNPSVFYQLVDIPIALMIERGRQKIKAKNDIIEKIIRWKTKILLDYQDKQGENRRVPCYFLETRQHKMKNSVGVRLAEMSFEAGLANLAVVHVTGIQFQQKNHSPEQREHLENLKKVGQVKISVRCSFKYPVDEDCEQIATQFFKGGGHKMAAGCEVPYQQIEQWKDNAYFADQDKGLKSEGSGEDQSEDQREAQKDLYAEREEKPEEEQFENEQIMKRKSYRNNYKEFEDE